MNFDIFTQKLFGYGVHQSDYQKHRNWFEKCAQCHDPFDEVDNLPNLLQCGHFCCSKCLLSQFTKCVSGVCNKQKRAKIKNFKDFFHQNISKGVKIEQKKEKIQAEKRDIYNFVLKLKTGTISTTVLNQTKQAKMKDIIAEFDQLTNFIMLLGKKVNLIINTSSFRYEDIKEKTIQQLTSVIHPTSYKNHKNSYSNMITMYDRQLGGRMYEQ